MFLSSLWNMIFVRSVRYPRVRDDIAPSSPSPVMGHPERFSEKGSGYLRVIVDAKTHNKLVQYQAAENLSFLGHARLARGSPDHPS